MSVLKVEEESEIDVNMELQHNVLIGENFTVKATVTNKASSPRYDLPVQSMCHLNTVSYT